jgi:hypothetical protein
MIEKLATVEAFGWFIKWQILAAQGNGSAFVAR